MTSGRPGGRARIYVGVGTLLVVIATIIYVLGVMYKPAYGAYRSANRFEHVQTMANGQTHTTLELNIVQTVNTGPHSDWLGYQTLDGNTPGTVFSVPAHSLVTIIVHNYDSRTALRNTFFTLVQGTVGGVEYVNNKPIRVMSPDFTSHTFTIPDLGVSVPMEGIPSNAKANAFETMKFTFRTNGTGVIRWQCIVPCGSGLNGFGGPMQEIGYMDGLITVT
ncbi:MAG: hypothetical protein ACR2GA_03185 [Chloroflexota bacterium]